MKKTSLKKPSLKKALRRIAQQPGSMFGTFDIDLSTLPCLLKSPKEKITANFDADLLKRIREIAKKHDVSYTNLMNDALRRVFGLQ